jgi:hypothetical protein
VLLFLLDIEELCIYFFSPSSAIFEFPGRNQTGVVDIGAVASKKMLLHWKFEENLPMG